MTLAVSPGIGFLFGTGTSTHTEPRVAGARRVNLLESHWGVMGIEVPLDLHVGSHTHLLETVVELKKKKVFGQLVNPWNLQSFVC